MSESEDAGRGSPRPTTSINFGDVDNDLDNDIDDIDRQRSSKRKTSSSSHSPSLLSLYSVLAGACASVATKTILREYLKSKSEQTKERRGSSDGKTSMYFFYLSTSFFSHLFFSLSIFFLSTQKTQSTPSRPSYRSQAPSETRSRRARAPCASPPTSSAGPRG